MDVILKGLGFGIILAFAIGPVFFSLIQTSVERGFIAGFVMALGISISDISFVLFSYLGFSKLISLPEYKYYFGIIGGVILIVLGVYTFLKKKSYKQKTFIKNPRSIVRALVKGFVMNTVSPFVLIFWLGVMGFATVDMGFHDVDLKIFFGTILLSVLTTDITKAYLANKLGLLIKPGIIKIMNILVGIILLGFGIRLLYYAFTL